MNGIGGMGNRYATKPEYESKGFAGMVSGMDTEDIVRKMTMNIQSKIDRVNQQKTKNEWKQEAYRGISSALIDFQNKYFSFVNSDKNILSSQVYNVGTKVPQGTNASAVEVLKSSTGEMPYDITSVKTLAKKASYFGENALSSGKISTGTLNFGDVKINDLAGASISLTYDNRKFDVTLAEDLGGNPDDKVLQAEQMAEYLNDALEKINMPNSSDKLKDRVQFTANDGKLTLEAVDSNDTRLFQLNKSGNPVEKALLEKIGFDSDELKGSGASPLEAGNQVDAVHMETLSLKDQELEFILNGTNKKIKFTEENSNYILEDGLSDEQKASRLEQVINQKLEEAFGVGKITANLQGGTRIDFETSDQTSTLRISSNSKILMGTNGLFNLENNAKNRLDLYKQLSDISGINPTTETAGQEPEEQEFTIRVNNKEFTFKGTDTLKNVMDTISSDGEAGVNIEYLNTVNKFAITGDETGANSKVDITDIANGSNLASALFGITFTDLSKTDEQRGVEAGQDLEMTVKYKGDNTETNIVRSKNVLDLDGLKFNTKSTFGWNDDGTGNLIRDTSAEVITFNETINTDKAVDLFVEMATDYNKIIDSVNKLVSTKRAKDFNPLTAAQKREMTKSEIEKWEEKAKEGILFGDRNLINLAGDMRFIFSGAVGNLGTAKDLGINISNNYAGNGKIQIDKNKLKEALTNDPEKVKSMFMEEGQGNVHGGYGSMTGGFATRMRSVMESYAKETGSNKGILVQHAGLKNNILTKNNFIDKQQKELDTKLEALKKLLDSRRKTYQSRFSKLEVYMSKMMAQSSWMDSNM